jgi:hypothetical protein
MVIILVEIHDKHVFSSKMHYNAKSKRKLKRINMHLVKSAQMTKLHIYSLSMYVE